MMAESDIKQMYENMFAHRFTAKDEEYQKYLSNPESQPPVVEDWSLGNQRNQDRYRDNRNQRGWDRRRDWSNNSYNQYNQHRGRGWGNSYNQQRTERSYQQEGSHSYNSGKSRYYPDTY